MSPWLEGMAGDVGAFWVRWRMQPDHSGALHPATGRQRGPVADQELLATVGMRQGV